MHNPPVRARLLNLGPMAQLRAGKLPMRLSRLGVGLALYGLSVAMMIRAAISAAPWDVFHQGLARHLPLSFGVVMVLASIAVLLVWIPLRQIPGLGTIANALMIGPFANLGLALIATPDALWARVLLMLGGVLLCGFATGLYIGAQLGTGPRDGLMTGLARRSGWPIRRVRTLIEVAVLLAGVLLGGVVGAGTLVFALGVGPATQYFLPRLVVPLEIAPPASAQHAET